MSDYSARWDEVQSGIRGPQEKDLSAAGQDGALQAQALARYTTYVDGFKRYCDRRDQILNDALAILREESSSVTADGQQSRWADYFSKASSEASSALNDLVKEENGPAPQLRAFGQTIAQQETQFFDQLRRMPLALVQGQLQTYTLEFFREADNLEAKWKALGDQDKPVNQKLTDTTTQIRKIFESIVETVIKEQRTLIEGVRNVKVDPSAPMNGDNSLTILLKGFVQIVMVQLEPYRRDTASYVNDVAQLQAADETIIILFTQIRDAVRQFLNSTNFTVATRQFNEGSSAARDIAGQCPTSGQQTDARRLADKAASEVENWLKKFKDEYDRFIDANRGIFVGAVESKAINELLAPDDRTRSWDEIERVNIQSKLKEVHSQLSSAFDFSIEGLSDDDKKTLTDIWKTELEKLAQGLVSANEDHIQQQLKEMLKDKVSALKDRITGSKGGLE